MKPKLTLFTDVKLGAWRNITYVVPYQNVIQYRPPSNSQYPSTPTPSHPINTPSSALLLLQTAVHKTADHGAPFLIPTVTAAAAAAATKHSFLILSSRSNFIMLGFKASDLGNRPRKPGLGVAARAATVITGVVSAVVVARTAVPYSAAVIATAIPVVRAWMAPPFLFAAIHFIILTIWKLSENKHQYDPSPPLNDDKPLAKIASLEIPQTAAVEDFEESEVIIPNNYSDFGRSMSEQDSGVDIKLASLEIETSDFRIMSVEEPPVVFVTVEEDDSMEASDFRIMSVEEPPVVLVTAEEDDSMEARWKAIMQGGAAPVVRFTLPETAAGGELVREASEVGQEDLNQRFDAFIKKNYEQIRVATALRDG